MNKGLHKRIEETLNSLDGLQRAEANPYLYSKIRNRLQSENELMPKALAWRMIVVLAIVALVNVITIRHFQLQPASNKNGTELVANEYAIALPQTY